MITTSEDLASLIDHAKQARCVALDTEFVWEQTYYPILGVVQVGLPDEEPALIDVPAIKDMAPLGKILSDPAIVKILHDAQQDLTIIKRATGSLPRNIFDTRCAAGFVGSSSSISLSALLREALGVDLPKTETRTDWLQRPLTDRQIAYAKDDVRYLPGVYDELLSRARDNGRETWLAEEMALYDDPDLYKENDAQNQYHRVKGYGRLDSRKLAILRELAAWREAQARQRNLPRPWVMSDETLMELVRQKPRSISGLKSMRGISEKTVQRSGDMILQAIERGLEVQPQKRPKPAEQHKDDDSLGARVDLALAYMKGKSMYAGIDPALVASRAEITALVREGESASTKDHRLLQGWRREFLGEELLLLLSGRIALQLDTDTGFPRIADK